jgi:hypothetical protein
VKTTPIACWGLFLGISFWPACGTSPFVGPSPVEIPGPETGALTSTLQRQGASVALAEVMSASAHPYFRVQAARFVLNGENLYVFEYENSAATTSEASRIGPDGTSVGTTQVSWISDPHFFRSGRLIVLYVGREASILVLLQDVLGQQIGGR